MAADQSLISASLKEALSRVGPDKTKYYESMVNIPVNLMAGIAETFKQKQLQNNEAWENVAGNTEEMLNSLASEDQLGNMGQANIDHLKSLKQEFLAANGNKDEENKVKIKIQKVVKTINKLAAGFGKYGEAYLSDTLDKTASDPEFTNILGRIWEKDGEYGDIEFNWKENGDLDFIVDGFATNSNMLFDKLILKNPATTSALDYDRGGNIQQVKSLWDGPEGKKKFATVINSSTFGNSSFVEAIYSNKSIHKALQELNKNKFDTDGSGTVDKNDFVSDENKQLLLDALTNVHSSNFDFETAKEVAASWYTDSYLQGKYNDGVTAKNNSMDSGGNSGLPFDNDQSYGQTGDYTSGSVLNKNYDDIKNRNNFEYNGITARAGDTGWEVDFKNKEGKDVTSGVTTSQLIAMMRLDFIQFNELKNDEPFSVKSNFDFAAGIPGSGVLKNQNKQK